MPVVERTFTRRIVEFAKRFWLALAVFALVWPFLARTGVEIFRQVLPAGRFYGYNIDWLLGLEGIHDFVWRFGDEMTGPLIELYAGLVVVGWLGPLAFLLWLALFYRHPDASRWKLVVACFLSVIVKLPRADRTDLLTKARPVYFIATGVLFLVTAVGTDFDYGRSRFLADFAHSDMAAAGLVLSMFAVMGACFVMLGLLIAWRTANIRVLPEPDHDRL